MSHTQTVTLAELDQTLAQARAAGDRAAVAALIPRYTAAGRSDVAALLTAILEGTSL
jgi:hypothetical protein